MRKILNYMIIGIILTSCTKPILLRNVGLNKNGMLSYGENSNRTFYIDQSISTDLIPEWIAETDGSFSNGSVLVYDNYMFAADLSGNIFCFSDTSGKKLGVLKQKGEIDSTPIIMKDKLVYLVNNYKEKYATLVFYQFVEGVKYKEVELTGNFTSEILVTDDGFILLSQRGTLYKFNPVTEQDWKYESDVLTFSNPYLSDGIIYFAGIDGIVYGFSINERKIVFEEQLSDGFESSPMVISNHIYIGDAQGILYCYDKDSGCVIWQQETGSKIINQPVIDKSGNVYIGNLGGDMFSFTSKGSLRWQYNSDGIFNAVPLVFNNIVVQPDMNRKLLFLDSNTGKLDKEITFNRRVRTSPVYFNGKLYIGIDKDEIHAFNMSEL